MSHYHLEIIMPPTDDVDAAVTKIMAPFNENPPEEAKVDSLPPFWDFWQIGGRWTGAHDPSYIPEDDPRNHETCFLCGGTGFRRDDAGEKARERDPTYTCNGCGTYDNETKAWKHILPTPGVAIKWPTQWVRFGGDVAKFGDVPDDFTAARVIFAAPNYKDELAATSMFSDKIWNGCNRERTTWNGTFLGAIRLHRDAIKHYSDEAKERVTPYLDWLVVTVDYHS